MAARTTVHAPDVPPPLPSKGGGYSSELLSFQTGLVPIRGDGEP